MNLNEFISLILSHSSVRHFRNEEIPEETVQLIIRAAQSASSTSLIQAYTIIGVTDEGLKKQIAALSGDQEHIRTCPLLLVFCADLHRLQKASSIQRQPFKGNNLDAFITATVDTSLAAQNAMLAAESLGLGGCYISGIRDNPKEICDLLQLPETIYPVFGMCLGYPSHQPETKLRLPLQAVYKKNRYSDEGDEQQIRRYDQTVSEIMKQKTNGRRSEGWTSQVAKLMAQENRPHMRGFLAERGFHLE